MLKKSLVITGISLLGSGLGFLVQVLLAREFGAGVAVDAYLFATGFPIFLAGFINTTFAYSLVPKVAGFEGELDERRRFIGAVLFATLGLALIMTITGISVVEAQLSVLPAQSPIRTATDLKAMMYAGWFLCGIQVISGCLIAILNGTGRFFSAAFLGLGPYLGMIIAIAGSFYESALALPVGMTFGSIAACLLAIFMIRVDFEFFCKTTMPWLRVLGFISSAPYIILATSCFSIYVVIDSYWAPQAGAGVFSNLGYAQRMIIAIGNLAIIGPYTLIGPRLAILLSAKDMEAFRRVTLYTLLAVCVVSLFLATAMGLGAELLVEILFSRGAFGSEEVLVLASTLRHMAPGMVGMLLTTVLLKVLFILPGTGFSIAAIGLTWPLLYFTLSGMLIDRGASGIATAYSVAWCLVAAMCGAILVLRIKRC